MLLPTHGTALSSTFTVNCTDAAFEATGTWNRSSQRGSKLVAATLVYALFTPPTVMTQYGCGGLVCPVAPFSPTTTTLFTKPGKHCG